MNKNQQDYLTKLLSNRSDTRNSSSGSTKRRALDIVRGVVLPTQPAEEPASINRPSFVFNNGVFGGVFKEDSE